MEYEPEPHLWEYEDAMRFISPNTLHLVEHDDGDCTLEGEPCNIEVNDDWVADVKRRIDALNRAGQSTAMLARILDTMQRATTDDDLRGGWERFEAALEWMMDELVAALHAKYDD